MDIINLHKYTKETNNCHESRVIWEVKTTLLLPGGSDRVKTITLEKAAITESGHLFKMKQQHLTKQQDRIK